MNKHKIKIRIGEFKLLPTGVLIVYGSYSRYNQTIGQLCFTNFTVHDRAR